jgi:hypothetical protein
VPWVEKKKYSTKQWEIITFTEDRSAPYIYGDNTQDWAELYFSEYGLSAYPFEWIKEDLSKLAINEEQKKYLRLLTNRALPGHRWWDMVAVERHPEGERTAKVWLVDLKTGQVSIKNIKSLQKTGKMPSEEQMVYEKSLGFGHLIISVQLVTHRQVEVSCQEI